MKPENVALHAGCEGDSNRVATTPIYQTVSYTFDDHQYCDLKTMVSRLGYITARTCPCLKDFLNWQMLSGNHDEY